MPLTCAFTYSIYIHYGDRPMFSKRSIRDFGFLNYKGNTQNKRGSTVRTTTSELDYKLNELAFADEIALPENDSSQDRNIWLKFEAEKVGLEINEKLVRPVRKSCS